MNTFNMTCEAVEATLPDYMDETLEPWVRSSVEEHLGQCLRCAGLVRDLRSIERDAAVLPDLTPVRDLWPGIESRIGTPVVAFTPPVVDEIPSSTTEIPHILPVSESPITASENGIHSIDEARDNRRRLFPAWMGAAAAALVVLTAGTTYLLTARAVRSSAPPNVAIARPEPTAEPDPGAVNPFVGNASDSPSTGDTIRSESSRSSGPAPRNRTPLTGRGPSANHVSRSAEEAVYDKEILMLQSIMRWRKAELDPATAAIIEKNLKIIDSAIAQSRAALRRDPASAMISEQLTHALDKKVELLRTAAMLPAST